MGELLHVSSSPHIRSKVTTDYLMKMVIVALMPATVAGVCFFGWKALLLVCLSVATCVATEGIYETLMHKPLTIWDGSAVITGLLLGLNLPASAPWWIPVIGGVFAILIVKQLFGGLGQNIMNPALAAVKAGEKVDLLSLFLGNTQGTIGETSALAILIGAAFLLILKVIDWRIPCTYIGSFAIFVILFGGHGADGYYLLEQLLGGGLMLGAWFMATDYVTTPITKRGQLVYGVILGCLTGLFRIFGASAEGVSYAIIFGNLLIPVIERLTVPTAFGKGGVKHEK